MRPLLFAALTAATLSLTACEDPSNVGIGLVGDEGGRPHTQDVTPADLRGHELGRTLGSSRRILVGQVDDPLLGFIQVDAYVDFSGSSGTAFKSGTVQRAELHLVPEYAYGDTTSVVRVALRQITAEWSSAGLPADTMLSVGPVITEFDVTPSDTTTVVLPQDWVEANDALLRSSSFSADFYGFSLEAIDGNNVVGFGVGGSALRAWTASDSVAYLSNSIYLAGRRTGNPALPPNRVLLQASAGPSAVFSFTIDPEDIPPSAVNSVILTFAADTLALEQNLPAGFVRPQITTLDLFGVTPDETIIFLGRSSIDKGRFVFGDPLLAREIQRVMFGDRTYTRYELRVPAPVSVSDPSSPLRLLSSTVNALFLYDSGAGEQAPRGSVTITSVDE